MKNQNFMVDLQGNGSVKKPFGNSVSNLVGGIKNTLNQALSVNPGNSSVGSYSASSSTTTSANPYAGYADQIKSLYEQQQQKLNEYQQAQNAAAQNAYNKNYAALQSAYNNKISNLDSSLQNAKRQLAGSYDASKQSINADASKAMQEAYVNRMMAQKNLQQQLTAQGLSGGASESAVAGLINNYGNARNEIDTTRNNNLSNLEQNYNQNLADIMQNYYNAKSAADENRMAYQMQLENALADNSTASYGTLYNAMANLDTGYLNAMQKALENQAAYQAKANTASNKTETVSTQNANTGSNALVTNLQKQFGSGTSADDLIIQLSNRGYSADQIMQLFSQAGIQ